MSEWTLIQVNMTPTSTTNGSVPIPTQIFDELKNKNELLFIRDNGEVIGHIFTFDNIDYYVADKSYQPFADNNQYFYSVQMSYTKSNGTIGFGNLGKGSASGFFSLKYVAYR